jgi:dihydropteroate synthase
LGGADILRVHDVKEAVEAIKLIEHVKNGQGKIESNKDL